MAIDDSTTCTAAELGALLGLTDRRIRQLAADGVVAKAERGQYRLGESIRNIISATEGRAEPDDLRRARLELMQAQTRRIEQDISEREGTADDLSWQDALVRALSLTVRLRVREVASWLHAEIAHRDVRMAGVQDAARDICGQVHEYALGIADELETEFLALAADARRRGVHLDAWRDMLKLRTDSGELVDDVDAAWH